MVRARVMQTLAALHHVPDELVRKITDDMLQDSHRGLEDGKTYRFDRQTLGRDKADTFNALDGMQYELEQLRDRVGSANFLFDRWHLLMETTEAVWIKQVEQRQEEGGLTSGTATRLRTLLQTLANDRASGNRDSYLGTLKVLIQYFEHRL